MRMTVEMARDLGLIPDVDIYVKTLWGDRLVTNAEYERRNKAALRGHRYDPKTHTVAVSVGETE